MLCLTDEEVLQVCPPILSLIPDTASQSCLCIPYLDKGRALDPYTLDWHILTHQILIRLSACFSFSRSALWVGTTSFMILVLPVVFETERLQLEQQQLQQQRQVSVRPPTLTPVG